MRIVYFSKYSISGPSSRYRIYQYLPFLMAEGVYCKVCPLFGETYFSAFSIYRGNISGAFFKILYSLWRFTLRLKDLTIHAYRGDLVVIQSQLFPYIPPIFELILYLTGKGYVVEYDDATYAVPAHRWKIGAIMRWAKHIIVGNRVLMQYAKQHNQRVTVIPTVIPIEKYKVRKYDPPTARIIIGWVGLPYNIHYLKIVEYALRKISLEQKITFRVVSAFNMSNIPEIFKDKLFEGIEVEWREWKLETEVSEIQNFHIGIMPLTQDEWSMAKCGAKLLQYMAAGIPSVASPAGVNKDIITDGENGFLAETSEDWYKKLSLLCVNTPLRNLIGTKARKTVETYYSLDKWAPRLIDLYSSLMR